MAAKSDIKEVTIKQLSKVVIEDANNELKDSGKWPMVIDTTGLAATFLRYQDLNYIEALNPSHMDPERIRQALLGSVRYNKPVLLDMMENNLFDACVARFDDIQPGLMNQIMDKSILKKEVWAKLVKDSDGPEYQGVTPSDSEGFKFIILTQKQSPPEDLQAKTFVVKVI